MSATKLVKKKGKARHPIQPLVTSESEIVRFKRNAIVCHLLDNGPLDMNYLSVQEFSQEDREQFAQLIGYSLCGFGELNYVSDKTYKLAASQDIYQRQPGESKK